MRPFFTVITVCLNAQKTIRGTIESVVSQECGEYEYIITDGESADGTWEMIKQYREIPQIKAFSEKDAGLYNAMNKAIKKSSGQYLIFMNSGDTFYSPNVLKEVREYIEHTGKLDIYYGNTKRIYSDKQVPEKYPGRRGVKIMLLAGKMPCHQSVFASAEVMRKYMFDESYSITADFNFFMKCVRYNHSMKYMDLFVSCSECVEGISSKSVNLNEMRRQDDRSIRELYPFWYYALKPVKFVARRGRG